MIKNSTISKLTEKYLRETDDNIIGVSYTHNVVGGMITNEMVLSFIVRKKLPLEQLTPEQIIPAEISYYGTTFKTDVVEENIVLLEDCAEFANRRNITASSNRSKIRPLKGGVSTTNYTSLPSTVGTLGFIAVDNTDNTLVGVSNNHVYIDDAFIATERTNPSIITNIANDRNVEPHPVDGYNYNGDNSINYIGKVKRYVPLKTSVSNKVDGALTTLNNNVVSLTESWKYEGLTGITSALSFATTAEIDALSMYNILYSAGRTTGAKGETDIKLLLTSKNASVNISYNKQGDNQSVLMTNCIMFIASGASTPIGLACAYPIAGGDSGSALIGEIGGVKKIIGLVFAGSEVNGITTTGIACRIDNVASELNIRAWGGEAVNFSSSIVDEIIISGLDSRTYIDSDGKRYYQAGLTNLNPTQI